MRISDWSSDVCSSDLANAVGKIKILDGMGQITLRIGEKFGWCPSICRKTTFSERRNRLHHFRTQSFKTIERQRTAKLVRQSAEDGQVLARLARREYGLVATLQPAFQVHISTETGRTPGRERKGK